MKKFFASREYRLGDLVADVLAGIAVLVLLAWVAYYIFPIIQSTIAGWFSASPAEVVFF